jgi:LmbE family N-acetylglucosaminyl deacetylase
MLSVTFNKGILSPLKVLCLGAHADDIEIGCGGSLLRLLGECDKTCVHWVVFSGNAERHAEAEKSANLFLKKAAQKEIILRNFRESFFPYIGEKIKEYFDYLKAGMNPDIVFTHYRNDLHQDHRLLAEMTWQTFRDHLILEYEIPKFDGDIGSPNLYVHLNEEIAAKKVEYLDTSYASQKLKKWFKKETFLAMLRLRGIESNAAENLAEGFYCRKLVLGAQ